MFQIRAFVCYSEKGRKLTGQTLVSSIRNHKYPKDFEPF